MSPMIAKPIPGKDGKKKNSEGVSFLYTKIPAASKLAKDAQEQRLNNRTKQTVFNLIDYEKIVAYMEYKGYVLDKNGSFQNAVKKTSNPLLAGFQLWFRSTKLYEPYGYPHVIKIKTRENGSRMVAVESCVDYFKGKRNKACLLAFSREKFDHRESDTERILSHIKTCIQQAKFDIAYLYRIKTCNMSLSDISWFRKTLQDDLQKKSIAFPFKHADLMQSWHNLPYIGHVILQIQSDLLIGQGKNYKLYNMMLAYNNLTMGKKLGGVKNVLVCSEDDAFVIMQSVSDILWTFFDRREKDIASEEECNVYDQLLEKFSQENLEKMSKEKLRSWYNNCEKGSLQKALIWRVLANKA